jgi:type II secretory pathway component GspD/PulD (secretin)
MRRAALAFCLLLAAALPWPVAGQAGMKVEVIPLKGRTAEEIIPVIRPLLVPGGSVSGMDSNLIVKTTPENLDDIRSVLEGIDRPLRTLRITVSQDADTSRRGHEVGVSGRVRSGDVEVDVGDARRRRDGLEAVIGDDDELRARLRATEQAAADRNSYFVNTVEGRPAFIETGASVPIRYRDVRHSPWGHVVQEGYEYRDATSGFYVLPRLSGDGRTVTLMVSPFMTHVIPGRVPTFDVQNAETTLTVPLGQWVEIGGIDTEEVRSERGILTKREARTGERRSIRLKVDAVP